MPVPIWSTWEPSALPSAMCWKSRALRSPAKLAAQFYFKDMTVLKVMFTAIVVAMVLIFLTTGFGWLDFNLIWVNPTYLWPGIVGGLIMGVGFIVGGFCPGTSLRIGHHVQDRRHLLRRGQALRHLPVR